MGRRHPTAPDRHDSRPTECWRCNKDVLQIRGWFRSGALHEIRLWCPLCDGLDERSRP